MHCCTVSCQPSLPTAASVNKPCAQFGDHSFDIILDKGSLDALMGEESPEASSAGRRYLRETARLLRTPGSFLCITLAQQHVLRTPAMPD